MPTQKVGIFVSSRDCGACTVYVVNVFTYYDASPDAAPGQAESFRAWEKTWIAHGWKPRILTSRRARQSSLFDEVAERLPQIEIALPWLALHAAGGGWLIPKSVPNTGFRPTRRRNRVIFYHPGILWGSARGLEEILRTAWTKEWDKFFLAHFKTTNLFEC